MKRLLPDWLRIYRRSSLGPDVTAGLTVAAMLAPQAMAYAMLAGLPPVMGLYASTIPLVIYALAGSSRHLAVGPVAMVSLIVFAACRPLAPSGSEEYIRLVLSITLLAGVIQILLGLARAGFLVHFVSHSAVSGFTSAAALVIIATQLKHILGYDLPAERPFPEILSAAALGLGRTHVTTMIAGIVCLAFLYLMRRRAPRFPAALAAVILAALAVRLLRLDEAGVMTVGALPSGFAAPALPMPDFERLAALAPAVLAVVFIGFMESIAVAESVAARSGYRILPNRELVALGLADAASAVFSGAPVTGGFSRTAVSCQSGARTQMSSLVTAAVIALVLVGFTGILRWVPRFALASVIIIACLGLVDMAELRRLYRIRKSDGWILLLTFSLTLLLGVERGLLSGIVLSLVLFIARSARPHTAVLGYLPKEGLFRNVSRFPDALTFPGVLILRVDASLYFANMAFVEDILRAKIGADPSLRQIILDVSGVNDMDAAALTSLQHFMERRRSLGLRFLLAGMKGPVRDIVGKAGWREIFGDDIAHPSLPSALASAGVHLADSTPAV